MSMNSTAADSNPLRGIFLKILSVTIFVAMSALIKAAGQLPSGQIVFFRSLFAILPIVVMLAWRKELRGALYTANPLGHVARGTVGVISMALTFFALTRLPLPEAITLNYAQPLMVVVFSAIFLHEAVRAYRWTAVIIGFIGVLIVSWPNMTLFWAGEDVEIDLALGVAAALAAAAMSAIAMLLVRYLVHTEKTPTIVLWFSITATVLSLLSVPFGWEPLSFQQCSFLIAAGVCGGIAQILMTESYRFAEASTVAPFEYTSMLLGIAVGYLAFGDLPTIYTIVGGAIVIGAGIFIIMRERNLGLERNKARKANTPQ